MCIGIIAFTENVFYTIARDLIVMLFRFNKVHNIKRMPSKTTSKVGALSEALADPSEVLSGHCGAGKQCHMHATSLCVHGDTVEIPISFPVCKHHLCT